MKHKIVLDLERVEDVVAFTTNVNSDLLVDEVITFMSEIVNNLYMHDFKTETGREIAVDNLEYFCGILYENDIVETFDVVFDKRNNVRSDLEHNRFVIEITFKQKNCLNITSIILKIGFGHASD